MPLSQTVSVHFYPVRTTKKRWSIKGLVVCYVVWLESMIYGMGLWDKRKVRSQIPCCSQDGFESEYRNNPMDSYRYIELNNTFQARR